MAYNKKNWQDNVSDITAAELNRMEQGIYDNSLVVDAVTNKLNPTDTETYKTAELTEGQITDVIGVNDIVIKGQTLQDGEPAPSSPVDINVVSGSNVINTSNKNLLDINISNASGTSTSSGGITVTYKDGYINLKGTSTSQLDIFIFGSWAGTTSYIDLETGDYSISIKTSNNSIRFYIDKTSAIISGTSTTDGKNHFTLTENTSITSAFIRIPSGITINENIYLQLEQSSTATTYEPHQGKELHLDLPVENLCTTYNFVNATILNDGQIYEGTDRFTTDYIKVKGNTQYRLNFKEDSNINFYGVAYYDANKTFISRNTKNGGNNLTFTTDSNTVYIRVFGQPQIGTIFTEESFNTYKIQLEQGSKANAYTPYGTDPIELCKIGAYQDYFYKSGSKWYLHKEIDKITSYNGETITTSYISTTGELSTGAKVYYVVTPTDTEITDTTLISQLEAIYNAPLYEETNITQTNNDLPMVLDITACKDNINGIKAFIRK